jgi:hypothetical protein
MTAEFSSQPTNGDDRSCVRCREGDDPDRIKHANLQLFHRLVAQVLDFDTIDQLREFLHFGVATLTEQIERPTCRTIAGTDKFGAHREPKSIRCVVGQYSISKDKTDATRRAIADTFRQGRA